MAGQKPIQSKEEKLSARVQVLSEALADALAERATIAQAARLYRALIDLPIDDERIDQADTLMEQAGVDYR